MALLSDEANDGHWRLLLTHPRNAMLFPELSEVSIMVRPAV